LIFDMDGVLCDSEPLIAEAAACMFAERYGVTVDLEEFRPFVGTGEQRYLGGVAERHGLRLDSDTDKKRVYDLYLQRIPGRLRPVAGAVQMVGAARATGWRIALATSADEVKMHGNMREIGISTDEFDAIITGDQVTRKKPQPDIFLVAARALGLAPSECIVVEDAIHGVLAAKAAGMRCLALTTTFSETDLKAAGADWTAPDFTQLPEGCPLQSA